MRSFQTEAGFAAWILPIVRPSPALAIRKFTSRRFIIDDPIRRGTISRAFAEFLGEQISAGKTLLISGGTGTGKTTHLRILADFIPEYERIVVIEDTPELHIRKPNIVAAGSQTNTFKSHVSFDDLLKDALRFRPDRNILGEVRGVEARTLLDSFNTGHSGSLATIHAEGGLSLCKSCDARPRLDDVLRHRSRDRRGRGLRGPCGSSTGKANHSGSVAAQWL
jgi:pilus assembly protein CpaF